MPEKAIRRRRRKKAEPSSLGLSPKQTCESSVPPAVRLIGQRVEEDGGAVVGSYRDPLGGAWQLLVSLPIDKVQPTPFQRDVSDAHLERLSKRIEELGRFGLCYEQNGRFAGGVYQAVLKRIETFLAAKLPKALEQRAERAKKLLALDEAVSMAVAELKARGFESPYLKNFVVARVNPLRFQQEKDADWDATIDKMTVAAMRFDASKIKAGQVARSGGPPAEE